MYWRLEDGARWKLYSERAMELGTVEKVGPTRYRARSSMGGFFHEYETLREAERALEANWGNRGEEWGKAK